MGWTDEYPVGTEVALTTVTAAACEHRGVVTGNDGTEVTVSVGPDGVPFRFRSETQAREQRLRPQED